MAARPQYSESPQQFRERLELPYNRIGWAFEERPELDSSATSVLRVLAFKAREGGTSTLAVETVCRLTRLGRSTVKRALQRLVLAGLIVSTGKSPGHWTNKYRLALSPYDLKMPTPRERGPTPKRFPRTKGRAAAQDIPVKNVPVLPVRSGPVEPESSLPVDPALPVRSGPVLPVRSGPRESRRLRKAKKESPPPSIQAQQRPASASAPAAPANGAPAPPSVRTNGNRPSGYRHVMDDLEEAYERDRAAEEPKPKPEPEPKPAEVTAAAGKLSAEVAARCGRPLDGAWARYPGLARELGRRDRREVVKLLSSFLEERGGWGVPEPGEFFTYYEPLRDAWREGRNGRRNGTRRRAA